MEGSIFQEEAPGQERVFQSIHAPGHVPRAVVFGRSLASPLAWCLVPLMILALIAVLQGQPVLSFLSISVPIAVAVAWTWTVYRLKSILAEIQIRSGQALTRTVWEKLARTDDSGWRPILDLRVTPHSLNVAIGDTIHELHRSMWPDYEDLRQALTDGRRDSRAQEMCPA